MDYVKQSHWILQNSRQGTSQVKFSKQLGYKFNIVNRWENGLRQFYWEDFLCLANHMNWPVSSILESVTHFKFNKSPSQQNLLGQLLSHTTLPLVKNKISTKRLQLLRRNATRLRFDEFLMLIHIIYGRVDRFIKLLGLSLPPNSLSQKYVKLIQNDPILALIKNAFELDSYRKLSEHSDQSIANLLNISINQITPRIQLLAQEKIIFLKDGVYKLSEKISDTGIDKKASKSLSLHMRKRIVSKLENTEILDSEIRQAFLIYSSNKELDEKVFELARQFYIDLRILTTRYEKSTTDCLRYFAIDILNLSK